MFDINFGDLINFFDLSVLIILFISCFFAFKNGLIKSIFNLGKWIAIIILIKFSFNILRPYVDEYIQNYDSPYLYGRESSQYFLVGGNKVNTAKKLNKYIGRKNIRFIHE